MDKTYSYLKGKNGSEGRPEFRLRKYSAARQRKSTESFFNRLASLFVGTILLPIGLFITGWTVQARTHWIGPDIVSNRHLDIYYFV